MNFGLCFVLAKSGTTSTTCVFQCIELFQLLSRRSWLLIIIFCLVVYLSPKCRFTGLWTFDDLKLTLVRRVPLSLNARGRITLVETLETPIWEFIIIIKAFFQICWGWLHEFCFSILIQLEPNPCWKLYSTSFTKLPIFYELGVLFYQRGSPDLNCEYI